MVLLLLLVDVRRGVMSVHTTWTAKTSAMLHSKTRIVSARDRADAGKGFQFRDDPCTQIHVRERVPVQPLEVQQVDVLLDLVQLQADLDPRLRQSLLIVHLRFIVAFAIPRARWVERLGLPSAFHTVRCDDNPLEMQDMERLVDFGHDVRRFFLRLNAKVPSSPLWRRGSWHGSIWSGVPIIEALS